MSEPAPGSRPSERESGGCIIDGCAGEICADQPQFSPCIWRAVYVCYQDAMCGRQTDGTCGWNPTPELTACVAAHQD
jgi:hypothetical protein